jgi:hypothetical protein
MMPIRRVRTCKREGCGYKAKRKYSWFCGYHNPHKVSRQRRSKLFKNSKISHRTDHVEEGVAMPLALYVGECVVCMEDILDNECTNLRCGHFFHTECIKKWAKGCPMCRNEEGILSNQDIEDAKSNLHDWEPSEFFLSVYQSDQVVD